MRQPPDPVPGVTAAHAAAPEFSVSSGGQGPLKPRCRIRSKTQESTFPDTRVYSIIRVIYFIMHHPLGPMPGVNAVRAAALEFPARAMTGFFERQGP